MPMQPNRSLYANYTERTDRFLLLCWMYIPTCARFRDANIRRQKRNKRRTCERNTYILTERNLDKILHSVFLAYEKIPFLLFFFLFVIRVIYSQQLQSRQVHGHFKIDVMFCVKQKWHDNNTCVYITLITDHEWCVNSAKIFIELSRTRGYLISFRAVRMSASWILQSQSYL